MSDRSFLQVEPLKNKLLDLDEDTRKNVVKHAIGREFMYFVKMVWKDMLPVLLGKSFHFLASIHCTTEPLQDYLQELVNYYINEKGESVKFFLDRIAKNQPDINGEVFIHSVCDSVSHLLTNGNGWEASANLLVNCVPPIHLLQTFMRDCIEQKKCRRLTMEVAEALRMIPSKQVTEIDSTLIDDFQAYMSISEDPPRPNEK